DAIGEGMEGVVAGADVGDGESSVLIGVDPELVIAGVVLPFDDAGKTKAATAKPAKTSAEAIGAAGAIGVRQRYGHISAAGQGIGHGSLIIAAAGQAKSATTGTTA